MSESKQLERRDSRDRLIDLLGIAETSPLRDVVVSDELKVSFQRSARITVSPGQEGVRYELRDHNGDGPPGRPGAPLERTVDDALVPVTAQGDGGVLELITPNIVEDRTFTLHAAKRHELDDGTTSVREVFLRQSVRIKVGLDLGLPARVRVIDDVAPLFPVQSADADPRITMYGSTVTVEIDGAQDGVDYDLVSVAADDSQTPRSEPVRGLGDDVTIAVVSTALHEDVELRIRATKKYTVAEAREVEVDLLSARLPVKVRANPDLVAAAIGGPIHDHAAAPVIRIEATQASASYQLFARAIHDRELSAAMVMVRPPWTTLWTHLDGFTPVGTAVAGTGGAIELPLPALTEDTIVLVRAAKAHAAATPASSAMQLRQDLPIFLRPDPAPALELRVGLDGPVTRGVVELLGGQPGVLYSLRAAPDGPDLGRPAYIHKRDDTAPGKFKGVSQMRLGADFVVADEGGGEADAFTYTAPIAVDTVLHVLAVKAQSQLSTPLTHTARIRPAPEIGALQVGVDAGATTQIRVRSAATGERYQLALAGQTVGAARDGDGGDLVLISEPVVADAVFTVEAAPQDDPDIAVRRVVSVPVPLRPQATRTARLTSGEPLDADDTARIVDHAASVQVTLDASEAGIVYRLVGDRGDGEQTLSPDVTGDGGQIALQIDHASEDVDLQVRAVRRFFADVADAAQPQLLLQSTLPLKVRADPTLAVTVEPAAIVEPGAVATLVIAASQASARYQLFARAVVDADRRFGDEPGLVLTTPVPDGPPVAAVRPPPPALWPDDAGYAPIGAPLPGTGGALQLPMPAVSEDRTTLVRVAKVHRDEPLVESALQLLDGSLVLVTPDLRPALTVRATIVGDSFASVELLGGQPGVFYALLDAEGQPIGEPAYVHAKDAAGPPSNRGVGQLRVGLDLVVPRGPDDPDAALDPPVDDPRPALVATGPRPLGESWAVRATWALTRVSRTLAGQASIPAPPQLQGPQSAVPPGQAATIVVTASVVGERYWISVDGAPSGAQRLGDGDDLELVSGALTRSARLTIHCARDEPDAIAVERVVAIDVSVGA